MTTLREIAGYIARHEWNDSKEVLETLNELIGWHDVTTEMPPDDEQVIVYTENGHLNVDYVDKDTGQFMHGVTKAHAEWIINEYKKKDEGEFVANVLGHANRALTHGSFITHWRRQIAGVDAPS